MIPIVENNIPRIIEICKKHKLKSLYLFGSTTNNRVFNDDSDIDFLYEYDLEHYPDWESGEFDIASNFFLLKESLEEFLSRDIDLIPNKSKNLYFIKTVEKSKELIYARP